MDPSSPGSPPRVRLQRKKDSEASWPSTVSSGTCHGAIRASSPEVEKSRISRTFVRVSDGIRTHDRLDHNQELYQLSYAHHGSR